MDALFLCGIEPQSRNLTVNVSEGPNDSHAFSTVYDIPENV